MPLLWRYTVLHRVRAAPFSINLFRPISRSQRINCHRLFVRFERGSAIGFLSSFITNHWDVGSASEGSVWPLTATSKHFRCTTQSTSLEYPIKAFGSRVHTKMRDTLNEICLGHLYLFYLRNIRLYYLAYR